ncbi:class I SAM-dependent methyltransferase [Streptomyces sp. NPDC002851]
MGHGQHAHHDDAFFDWNAMFEYMERNAEVYTPVYRAIVGDLRALCPAPGRILDAGSGPGVISCLLGREFPSAEVVAVDDAEKLLERAAARAERSGLAGRLRTHHAELPEGLRAVAPADVIWSGQALHHIGDQRAALAAYADCLAPGGVLVLIEGGLPARHLPRDFGIGRPGLESRMVAAHEDWFAEMRAALPGAKDETEDWPALLAAAGLRHVSTRSHLLDLPAPLPEVARAQVVDRFARVREHLTERLDAEDLATLDRLLDPADEASLHRRRDLYLLTAQPVYLAVKP